MRHPSVIFASAKYIAMKILHISDTHGLHKSITKMPEADIIIHSGDFTMNGSEQEAIEFMNWFCDLPYRHKIFISGNHDDCLYGANIDGLGENVHYLCNSGTEIEGVRFYGVPMFMEDCLTNHQSHNYSQIPDNIDVLITHTPPYGILDCDDSIHYGSNELLSKLSALHQLKAHLFGHIHAQHGIRTINSTIFSNGSMATPDYYSLYSPELISI